MNGKVKIGRKCAYLGYYNLIIPIDSFTIFMMIIVCLFLARILLELQNEIMYIILYALFRLIYFCFPIYKKDYITELQCTPKFKESCIL